ncbi:hypothetical protein ACIF85_19880 [Streptomyces sp. NPDC086033]|uniref:hypothetical protein n=1 Tax=Streptomyces sp. NPDC086033 TaxID=3365747 RepID=UPI0037CD197D
MAESHGEEFPRALTDPLAFAARLAADIHRDPAQLLVSPRDGFTDSDRRTVSDPAAGEMPRRTYREALRGASYSRLNDDLALLSDWGFDPAAAVRPALLRHSPASTRRPSSSPYCCGTAPGTGSPRSATSRGRRTASPASARSCGRTPAVWERRRPCRPYRTGSAHHRNGPRHDHSGPPYGRCVRGSTGCRLRCGPVRD